MNVGEKYFMNFKGFLFSSDEFVEEVKKEQLNDSFKFWVVPVIVYSVINFLFAFINPFMATKTSYGANLQAINAFFAIFFGFWLASGILAAIVWVGAKIFKVKATFKEIYKYMLYIYGFVSLFSLISTPIYFALFANYSDFSGLILSLIPAAIFGLIGLYLTVAALSKFFGISKLKALILYLVGILASLLLLIVILSILGFLLVGRS